MLFYYFIRSIVEITDIECVASTLWDFIYVKVIYCIIYNCINKNMDILGRLLETY